jgi:acyl-CoA reductase-like NAD-dependent aldehyde dehydrogenase
MDKDLQSLQEVRDLMRRAREAARQMRGLDPKQAWEIAHEVGPRLKTRAAYYATKTVEQTQIGRVEHKVLKNTMACETTLSEYGQHPLGGVRRDEARRLIEIGRPAGVVVGLSNSTSPVATIIFKAMLALLTRNVIVFSPHPVALDVCGEVVDELHDLGVVAGAPEHWIQIQRSPTLAATEALMQHEYTDLIVATGGTPMVRAAYRSGNPTIGVGSGNTPVYVDASADVAQAARQLVEGKFFDYGSACTSPSVALVHQEVLQATLEGLLQANAHVCSPAQSEAVAQHLYPNGGFNAAFVGRSPRVIASACGFEVPEDCQALVCVFQAQAGHVMFKEKLSPVLGLVCVASVDEAIDNARHMLARGGAGHTCGIHTSCEKQAVYWAAALDYYRVVVNGVTTTGATGTGTGLPYTFTVGTGYAGKSSFGDNLGAAPWMDFKRVAFPLPAAESRAEAPGAASSTPSREQVRLWIKEELSAARAQR